MKIGAVGGERRLLKKHARKLVRKNFVKMQTDGEVLFLGDTHKSGIEV
jgi:hypothetical protein